MSQNYRIVNTTTPYQHVDGHDTTARLLSCSEGCAPHHKHSRCPLVVVSDIEILPNPPIHRDKVHISGFEAREGGAQWSESYSGNKTVLSYDSIPLATGNVSQGIMYLSSLRLYESHREVPESGCNGLVLLVEHSSQSHTFVDGTADEIGIFSDTDKLTAIPQRYLCRTYEDVVDSVARVFLQPYSGMAWCCLAWDVVSVTPGQVPQRTVGKAIQT